MWGRLVTCGRLSIGLPKLLRNRQQADFQSAAGCHPAPQTKLCSRLNKTIAIREGGIVADAGCGPANLSIILSNVVGSNGKVYCEDINDARQFGLGAAKKNLKKKNVKNVVLVHGEKDNPKLPAGSLDAVMIVNAYHEMPEYQSMLKHIRESLKPDGRLVIMDNRPNRTSQRPRDKQVKNHVLSADLAAGKLEAAGFRIVHREDSFIDNPDSESSYWLISAMSR